MPKYRLSNRAKQDVREVRSFSEANWGVDRAYEYISGLYTGCERIGEFQKLGRPISATSEIRRLECEQHVIFYRIASNQALIVRILHKSMLPGPDQLE